MKHYKLINTQTSEEHFCNKVTIDGFDYYVSGEKCIKGDLCYDEEELLGHKNNKYIVECLRTDDNSYWNKHCKKVIATNNPNIDIYKVVSNCMLIEKLANELTSHLTFPEERREGIILGYNKSQETHPFTEDDMIEFAKFVYEDDGSFIDNNVYPKKQFLQFWKEQKPKIIYYN